MQIIIAPAKQMRVDLDSFYPDALPQFLGETKTIHAAMQRLTPQQRQSLWGTKDALTQKALAQFTMIHFNSPLTPAVMAYVGVQYQAMAPDLLTEAGLQYLQAHLRILSGFYGLLRPFDGIVPYRLEMGSKLAIGMHQNLYQFWGSRLHDALDFTQGPVINLASAEYAKAIKPYLQGHEQMIDVCFGHLVAGRVKTRATKAKIARGAMVRFMAEHQVASVSDMQAFDHPLYHYDPTRSTPTLLTFLADD